MPGFLSAVTYDWLGIDIGGNSHVDDWPVRISFDNQDSHVTRVQRRVERRDPLLLDDEK